MGRRDWIKALILSAPKGTKALAPPDTPEGATLSRMVPREPLTLLAGIGVIALLIVFVLLPILAVVTYPPLTDYLALPENGRWVRAGMNTCRMVVLSTMTQNAHAQQLFAKLGFRPTMVEMTLDTPARESA